ncbi:MAG: phosphotransferase [Lachnospiraceae bacterium]|nr:phosphotransferase [Lachnospiraceae bacterium]
MGDLLNVNKQENLINEPIQMQAPLQKDFLAMNDEERLGYLRNKEQTAINSKRKQRKVKFSLMKAVANKKLGAEGVSKTYVRDTALAGNDFPEDVAEVERLKTEKNNQILTVASYRLMKKQNAYMDSLRNVYNEAKQNVFDEEEEKRKRLAEAKKKFEEDYKTYDEWRKDEYHRIGNIRDYRERSEAEKVFQQQRSAKYEEFCNTHHGHDTWDMVEYRYEREIISDIHSRNYDCESRMNAFLVEGETAENEKKLRDYDEMNEDHEKFILEQMAEVNTYDFDIGMTNPEWIAANADALIRMTDRAIKLDNILFRYEHEKNKKLDKDEDTYYLFSAKKNQAEALRTELEVYLKNNGVKSAERENLFEGKNEADSNKTLNDRDENALKTAVADAKESIDIYKETENRILEKMTKDVAEEQEATVVRPEVNALTISDFIGMIGKKNRGQVVMKNGKLTMVNNGYFQRKKMGAASRENIAVKRQFVELALQRLDGDEVEGYRPYLLSLVGLTGTEKTTRPLTRKEIVAVMNEVSNHASAINHVMAKEGNQTLKSYAQKANSIFGEGPAEGDAEKVRTRKKKAIKAKIRTLIRQKGDAAIPISDARLDRLVDEHYNLLKDEIFKNARRMETIVSNIRGNGDPAIDMNSDVWDKLALQAVYTLAAKNESANVAANYNTEQYILSESFKLANNEQLGQNAQSMLFASLTKAPSEKVFEEIIKHREKVYGRELDPKFLDHLESFSTLIENAGKLTEYNKGLITREEGSLTLSKSAVMEAAETVKQLMTDNKDAYDEIAGFLSGTYYETGYRQIRNLMDSGVDLAARQRELLEGLSAEHESFADEKQYGEFKMRPLTAEEENVLSSLSKDERKVADVLLLRSDPSEFIKREQDDTAQSMIRLLNDLRSLPKRQAHVLSITVGEKNMKIFQSATGDLSLQIGNRSLRLPTPANGVISHIETDMCSNVKKYGMDTIKSQIVSRFMRGQSAYKDSDFTEMGLLSHDRELAVRIICSLADAQSPQLDNYDTEELMQMVFGVFDAEDAEEYKDAMDHIKFKLKDREILERNYINGKETVRLMEKLNKMSDDQVPVRLLYNQPVKDEEEEGPKWTAEERKVKDLMADIVFGSSLAWDLDEEARVGDHKLMNGADIQGIHYRDTLSRHADTFLMILEKEDLTKADVSENDSLLKRTINKMSVPDVTNEQGKSLKEELFGVIIGSIKALDEKLGLKGLSPEEFKTKINDEANRKSVVDISKSTNTQIADGLDTFAKGIQSEMTKATEEIFKKREIQNVNLDNAKLDKKLPPEEYKRRLAMHNKELNRRIEEEAKGDTGQGAFTKELLKIYFEKSASIDKRAMFSAMIRYSTPKNEVPKEKEEEEKTRQRGNAFGGYLKGAGPLLQKILQGMPINSMPKEMQLAVMDMKSNLMHIPEAVVKSRMAAMIQRSQGNVTKIDVLKSLGAASVGQAFLCRMYGPVLPEEGEEVVIKLLRPDARNKMSRESVLMREASIVADGRTVEEANRQLLFHENEDHRGATEKTISAQMKSIMEELDLTIEAKNANIAAVYNEGDRSVKSVGVNSLILPMTNALVLDKAPGTTVDRYIKDTKSEVEETMKKFYVYKDEVKQKDKATGLPVLDIQNHREEVSESLDKLDEILTRLEKRQKYLATVAEKWVQEGIYGEGFYHGDLHSGNIMIDDNKATIIDFGNATKLTEFQKKNLTLLTAASAAGDTDDFLTAFGNLLGESSQKAFKDNKTALKREIKETFKLGNKESAGLRISLIILKAQSLGIEVPSAINNFSQSQIRLQNTIDEVNQMIGDIKDDMAKLSEHENPVRNQQRPKHNETPQQFFSVMTRVLLNNLNFSLSRLGLFKANSYRKRLAK